MELNPDDPQVGRSLPRVVKAFGKPEIPWVGDNNPLSVYEPWEKVGEVIIRFLDIIEEAWAFNDCRFSILKGMDKHFPFTRKGRIVLPLTYRSCQESDSRFSRFWRNYKNFGGVGNIPLWAAKGLLNLAWKEKKQF